MKKLLLFVLIIVTTFSGCDNGAGTSSNVVEMTTPTAIEEKSITTNTTERPAIKSQYPK